jgi:TfoX/Sxy family transcriptional regulator of competence genes
MSSLNAHLKALVEELSAELPEVTQRRMFGSDAFFANTNIYSIVWDGRILLRFADEARFAAANALEGSGLFDPMGTGKTMRGWVAMPEELGDDPDALRPWLEHAHREAMSAPPKQAKKDAKKSSRGSPSPRPSPARGEGVSRPRARARRTATRR